jgi:hypothetical protein
MERATPIAARQRAFIAGEVGQTRDETDRSAGEARDAVPDVSPGTAVGPSDHFARNLAETSGAMFMCAIMNGIFRGADALAYKKYRDQLVADCGSPHDPVEVMLVEQLALAHLNAGRLHFKAANTESLEGARVYGGLAVLLQGELRRAALALKTYRSQARPQGVVAEDVPGGPSGVVKGHAPVVEQKGRRRRTG